MPPVSNHASTSNAPERILKAALEVFAELGFTGASTREIARRASVHQPAIAYHFHNKDQLWRAAADAVFRDFAAAMKVGLLGAEHGEERLQRMANIYVRFVAQKPEWATFVVHEGMQRGERSQWLIDTWIKPQARGLYKTITSRDWPSRNRAEARKAISILSILTGSTLIFSQQVQTKRFADVDPRSDDFIEQHVHTVFLVLKTLFLSV